MARAFTYSRFKLDRTQKKVIVYILAITLPLFLFSLYFIQNTASRELAKFAQEKAFHVNTKIFWEIENYLEDASRFTQEATSMLKLDPSRYTEVLPFLKNHVRRNVHVYGSALAIEPSSVLKVIYCKYFYESGGNVKEKWLMPPAYDYLHKEWYRRVKETKKGIWSKPYFDKGGGEVFMSTFSAPLLGRNNDFLGVITADIEIGVLSRKIQKMTFSKESFVLVFDKNGLLLSCPDEKSMFKKTVFSYAKWLNSQTLLAVLPQILNVDSGSYTVSISSATYTLYSSSVPNSDLKIAVFLKNDLIYRPLTELRQKLILIALGGIFLILLMIIFILHEFKYDIIKKTKLKNELELAKKIQMSFLPEAKDLETERFEIHSYLKAAKEVGGDLYGYKELEKCIVFYVGDVSGKGIPAALFMMATQIVLENTIDTTSDPAEIISLTNMKLLEISKSSMFVTLLVVRYDFTTQNLTFCNAGHPAFIIKKVRLFSPLGHIHPPVNIFEEVDYKNTILKIEGSFQVMCFSDGVTEAENSKRELFGTAMVAKSLSDDFSMNYLLKKISEFVKNNSANDDMTVICFKKKIKK